MPYSLKRTRDGAGDCGQMSQSIKPIRNEEGTIIDAEYVNNSRPVVGSVMRVGSSYTRSYSSQDYWTTTIVTEILEESEKIVRFKTGNSEYTWEVF